jgi:hypothetical protein
VEEVNMRTAPRRHLAAATATLALLAGALTLPGSAAQASVGFRDQPFGTIAWTGSTAVVTETGTNGDLYYWWNPGGDTSWHKETVAKSAEYEAPSIGTTSDSVVITAADASGNLDYWYQPYGSSTWHQQPVDAAGHFEEQGASIAVTSDLTMIAGIDNTDSPGDVDYFSQGFGSPTWSIESIQGGCC